MSDDGDKTCPLCAEEMDLTDQQLKPCKCGYEICVWCWHHIMDMAEKDETEGRCPACRTPYNKEKIVGTTANCGRLVSEMNVEKKLKSQKGKNKTAEARKQLSSVRVIQRNLVYIVGLPLILADEDILQRKEYFGQYGKVLKVSISRTAAGAIQNFANSTCSVYITYSKEEEAIRCIQSVHGFVLDGKPLRACFGTTKYCHAWLRNVPCANPDCLYLHEIGSQEDSFTKDEIISAYSRNRVQQIAGDISTMQRRSGTFLPPPADEYCQNDSATTIKPNSKSATNNPAGSIRSSPPGSSSGGSVALPAGASWGTRASTSQLPPASLSSSNGPLKKKPDTSGAPVLAPTAPASTNRVLSLFSDTQRREIPPDASSISQEEKVESLEQVKSKEADQRVCQPASAVNVALTPRSTVTDSLYSSMVSEDNDRNISAAADISKSDNFVKSTGLKLEKDLIGSKDSSLQNMCSDKISVSIGRHQELQNGFVELSRQPLPSQSAEEISKFSDEMCIKEKKSDSNLSIQDKVIEVAPYDVEASERERLSNDQGFRVLDTVANTGYLSNSSETFGGLNQYRGYSSQLYDAGTNIPSEDFLVIDKNTDSARQDSGIPVFSNRLPEDQVSSGADLDNSAGCSTDDVGENNIISNILSLDLDSWDESLSSPQNLARLLGKTDKQKLPLKVSNTWKVTNSNQSRFSFAREEEPLKQFSDVEPSLSYMEQGFRDLPSNSDISDDRSFSLNQFGARTGFTFVKNESDNFVSGHSHIHSNKQPAPRSQISAPPGFSAVNRAPPPGFSSHERSEPSYNPLSGIHLVDPSDLLKNQYHAPQQENIVSNGDIEFIDPAILAVGKGRLPSSMNNSNLDMRSNFSSQLSTFDNEARLQLLMQRSLPSHQNQRLSDFGGGFSSYTNAYGIPPRAAEQTVSSNLAPFSQLTLPQSRNVMPNGHWNGWSEVQGGNEFAMAELLRNERLGLNKFYSGYDESKFSMPSSGNIYNRTFGI